MGKWAKKVVSGPIIYDVTRTEKNRLPNRKDGLRGQAILTQERKKIFELPIKTSAHRRN